MPVSQIALTLSELLEDKAAAGLTSDGCARAAGFAHRSGRWMVRTYETSWELSTGESSVQTVACRSRLVQTSTTGPISGGDDCHWTRYPSGIDLLWYM